MADTAGKRDALERRRRQDRVGLAFAAFAIGCLLGAGLGHVVTSRAVDRTGGPEPDVVPPAIFAVDPPEGAALPAGRASFRITFTEILAAVPAVALEGPHDLTFDETFDGLTWRGEVAVPEGGDGAYALAVGGVRDLEGLTAPNVVLPYVVDTIAPSSRAGIAAANVTSVPFDVTWDATDGNGSGVARVEVWTREDGGPWALWTTSPGERGSVRLEPRHKSRIDVYALAVDRAGNREAPPPTPDASVRFDPSPPSAALLPVAGYWHRGPVGLAAIAGGDVARVALRFHYAPDNATWQGSFPAGNATDPPAWTFRFPLGPGHYRLFARAEAEDGTREADQGPAAAELAIGFDAEAPTAALPPVLPYWRATALAVEATVSDDRSGVARVDLLFAHRPNGTAPWSAWSLAAEDRDAPWSFAFDFPRGDGRYALAVRATDRAGWVSAVPSPDEAAGVGFNRDPPAAPLLGMPRWLDPLTRHGNLTWLADPAPDVVGFEVHRGTEASFVPERCPSATCVATVGRDVRAAWVPLPAENATFWFRVLAVDDGGLSGASGSVGAVFHGRGFDTPGLTTQASALPLGIAWSERLEYDGVCVDCSDAFRVTLARGDVITLRLGVPATGDFRILLLDGAMRTVARGETPGFGVWESLTFEVVAPGTYYVVVDWGFAMGGGRNEGWYTLTATVG